MARRPYVPDRVGDAAYPTQAHSRVGFTETMEPVYGTVVEDILTPEVREALVPAAYKNVIGITPSNAEQGKITDKSGDALTSALGILDKTVAAWRWDGFSLQLPSALTEAVNMLSDLLDTIIGFLEAVKVVLELVAALAQGLGDALKILIDQLKVRIDEILGLFVGKTGIYGIHIPLSMPGDEGMAARIKLLKETKVAIKNSATKALVGVRLSPSEWPGRTMLSVLPNEADLPGSIGGTEGFIQTLSASLADPGDYNRPEFGPNAWVGGYVVMYGGTDLTRLLSLWNNLRDLFGDFFGKDPGAASPPGPTGLSLEVLSPKMSATRGLAPRVAVRWDRPKVKFSLSNFYPNWVPVSDIVYAMPDQSSYTRAEATDALERTQGFGSGRQPGLGKSERAVFTTTAWPRAYIDSEFEPSDLGKTYVYRVGRRFRYQTAADIFTPGYLEVLSAPARVLLPNDAKNGSSGTLPNWFSYSLADILPQPIIDLVETLKVLIKQLLDIVTDTPSIIKEIVQNIIDELQKWLDLAKRLKVLLDLIKALLNIGGGAFAMGFFGLGGNDFLVNTLTSSIANAPSEARKASQVDPDADLGDKLSARLENASLTDVLSSAVAPDFGPSDSVGGFVLMAGDESMQAVLQTYKILQTLFGGGVKSAKSSAVLAREVEIVLSGTAAPASSVTVTTVLGEKLETASQAIFAESLAGVDAHENKGDAC